MNFINLNVTSTGARENVEMTQHIRFIIKEFLPLFCLRVPPTLLLESSSHSSAWEFLPLFCLGVPPCLLLESSSHSSAWEFLPVFCLRVPPTLLLESWEFLPFFCLGNKASDRFIYVSYCLMLSITTNKKQHLWSLFISYCPTLRITTTTKKKSLTQTGVDPSHKERKASWLTSIVR